MRARGLKLKMFCDWFLKSESTQNMESFYVFWIFSFRLFSHFFFNYRKTFRVFSLFLISNVYFHWILEMDWVVRLLSALKTSYSTHKKQHMESIIKIRFWSMGWEKHFTFEFSWNFELIINQVFISLCIINNINYICWTIQKWMNGIIQSKSSNQKHIIS